MAQQTILLGTVDNDGTGDTAKAGGAKINSNFTELYTLFASLGTASAADSTDFATAAQGALADTALQPGSVTSNATHTGDVTGATVLTIANDAVTGEKLRNSVGYSVIGRDLSTTGSPVDIVCTPDNGVLGRIGGNLRFDLIQTVNLQDDIITLAKIENFAQYTVLGRVSSGSGDPEKLTPAQLRTLISSDSGGGNTYLKADGTWSAVTPPAAPNLSSGAGAPVSTPVAVGDLYVDTTAGVLYVAVDVLGPSDWIPQLGDNSGVALTAKTTPVAADEILIFDSADSSEPKTVTLDKINLEVIAVPLSDLTTDLTTGAGKAYIRAPFAMTITEVRASVMTAPTGANLAIDINKNTTSIFSTTLTIDAGEKTSTTATTAAVLSTTTIADDDELTFDIDTVGSTVAGAGLIVYIKGYRS